MTSWLAIAIIVLTATALGSVIVLQFLTVREWRTLNGILASITLGVVCEGWIALVLAELSVLSLAAVLSSWLLLFLILFMRLVINKGNINNEFEPAVEASDDHAVYVISDRFFTILLALWLVIAGWLFFRPHEYILGGADAGVYVSIASELAHNGGFLLQDETLAQLDPALKEVFLRPLANNPVASTYLFPGFYVEDAVKGYVTPQFYPLHPVWQAVAFSLTSSSIEGVRAALLVTGLWMLLASLAIIFTARELGGRYTALLVTAALSVSALQVWFARYPTTEALTQFLLWSGLWAMVRWLGGEESPSLWACVSGSALGAVFLVRIDLLVLLPIFFILCVGLWLRGWRKSDWWFAVPFWFLVAHSFFHGAAFSAPYFSEHIGLGLRLLWKSWWLTGLTVIGGILLLWLLSAYRERYKDLQRFRSAAAFVLIGAFLMYAVYGWFIRPVILEPVLHPDSYSETLLLLTNHENWRRLGWYLSVPGIWLGVAGICLLIWRIERRTAVLVAVGVTFSVIYLWNIRANPHQIYVMRRYVPAVAPFFLLASAFFISQLPRIIGAFRDENGNDVKLGYGASLLIAGVWLLFLGWSARGFVSQIDNRGVLEQLATINKDIPAGSVLLFDDQSPVGLGDFWGTPLKYIFGHDAYTIRDIDKLEFAPLAETIESWRSGGRTVVWIGDPGWLDAQGIEHVNTLYIISTSVMEGSYEHKPQQIVPVEWRLPAAYVEPYIQAEG